MVLDYLFFEPKKASLKTRRFFSSLFNSAIASGLSAQRGGAYIPCKALVLYGLGGEDRYLMAQRHMANGGILLAFDIGYWERNTKYRKYRFSLNGLHPVQVMETPPPVKKRLKLDVSPKSKPVDIKTIMLVGNAPKSIAVGARNWTATMAKLIRRDFGGAKIIYRPKPKRPIEKNVEYDSVSYGKIISELNKVDLIVCRHSNVAVDAAIQGIPCVATHGAASLIYPTRLSDYRNQPSDATRIDFLNRLAYWQWGENETKLFWKWFLTTFSQFDYRKGESNET